MIQPLRAAPSVLLWNGARIAQGSRHGQSDVGPSAKVCVDETLLIASGAESDVSQGCTSALSYGGNFEFVQLRAGETTIAAALTARDKRRYFFINAGFDLEFSHFSPMRILLTETMRRGFDDLGCEIYDLGPGYEPYKFDWKPCVGTNYFCSLGGSGPYAKALAALYGVAFRRRIKKAGLSAQG
jgi:CelD/BcsL family acetyltransferase involved in cellulose biosynthesis